MEQVYARKRKKKNGKRKMDVEDKEEKYDTEGKLRELMDELSNEMGWSTLN
jgi:hypothetical protein